MEMGLIKKLILSLVTMKKLIIEGNDGRQKSLQDRREFPQVNPERVGK